jgi:tRNA threonylcarbamoyladenosine biosynthesis protein TsaB
VLILAFDTSGFSGSVALLEGPHLLAERELARDRRSAQTLAPAIAELLAERRVGPGEIGLVATTVGPGSFTGLRVGVTTAKTFAYAAGAELLGLSTLEIVACQAPALGEIHELHAVLDAQRKELFLGRFLVGQRAALLDGSPKQQVDFDSSMSSGLPELWKLESDRAIVPIEEWLQSLGPGIAVSGTGLRKLQDRLPAGASVVPEEFWEPCARTVGLLAWREYCRGRRDDLWKLAPVYLRPSYAEEKAKSAGTKPGAS